MASCKIKSIIFEVIHEDGTVEEREIIDEGNIIFAHGEDHDAKFWFATDLPDVAESTDVIAGCPTFNTFYEEGVTRDHKNTMMGIVADGNHDLILCAYTRPGGFGLVK